MKYVFATLTIALTFVAFSATAQAADGRKCTRNEDADLGPAWRCWTNGTVYLFVKNNGCVAAFTVHGYDNANAYYVIRKVAGNKLMDIDEVYDDVYSYCGLQRGTYYKIQVDSYYYDDDYDEKGYYSPWIRFKV